MSLDLAALVESFATGVYAVTRRRAGGFKRGVADPTADVEVSIRASVQPATGRDLLRLLELRRTNETRVLFTTTKLLTGDQGDPYEADVVSIEDQPWEIQHVEVWVQHEGVTAYRCIAQRAGAT